MRSNGEPPDTGDATVDEALRTLTAVMGDSLQEQAEVFHEVHQILQDRLSDLEG